MNDGTQDRLKAFLERNRNRLSNPLDENQETSPIPSTGNGINKTSDKSTKTQNPSQIPKPPSANLDYRNVRENKSSTPLDEKKTTRDIDGMSFEYQPVSLFDVIGNAPYEEGHESTRNNSVINNEFSRMQSSDIYSVAHSSPDRFTARNIDSMSNMKTSARNNILSEDYNELVASEKAIQMNDRKSLLKDDNKKLNTSKSFDKDEKNKDIEPLKPTANTSNEQVIKSSKAAIMKKSPNINGSNIKNGRNEETKASAPTIEQTTSKDADKEYKKYDSIGSSQDSQKQKSLINTDNHPSTIPSNVEKIKEESSLSKKAKENKDTNKKEDLVNQHKEPFVESSKKLTNLNDSTPSDNEFKKEIKNLIKIIKQEKEQVVDDLRQMAEDLNKYKSAFKKLKKQKESNSKPASLTRDLVEATSKNSLSENKGQENNQGTNKKDSSISIEGSISVNGSESTRPKTVKKETQNQEKDLKLKSSTSDAAILVNSSDPDFELMRNSVNDFVIKDMNLKSSLFYKTEKFESDQNSKPTITDLLASQREIINFLVKRYQAEEQRRLKTEEQASKVVLSMETAIKQLEQKETFSKSRSSASPIGSKRKTPNPDHI